MGTKIFKMKSILAILCLSLTSAGFVESPRSRFIFPPFAKEEMAAALTRPVSEYFTEASVFDEKPIVVTVEELRRIMTIEEPGGQFVAAKALIKREDLKTILRVVYAFKQGNVAAEEILRDSKTLALIPYLMEDVAHGSLEYYGNYRGSDFTSGDGIVRVAAVKSVSDILFQAPEFTGETMECLKAICRGSEDEIHSLSEKCRYLVQWWLLNKDAFEAGKWEETRPLPQEIIYSVPKEYTPLPHGERWVRELQPPVGSPAWELFESFEAWSERIVDPNLRNLDFVALSWDGEKVIEHPARSLNPNAKPQDRESRKTPAPRNPPESEKGIGARKGYSWMIAAAILMVIFFITWWIRRKTGARI